MEATIYNKQGKESGKVKLPDEIFGLSWNNDLVHQVAVSMMSNARSVIAHAKDRSEVRGGGRKPWRQKGTGRARHGSNRSPIWIGGGVTFGPSKDKNYSKKVNKKMSAKALLTVLSQKQKDGEIIFVDSLDIKDPKTKEAKEIILGLSKVKGYEDLASKKRNSAFIALGENNDSIKKSFNNFGNVHVDELRNMNVLDLLNYKYIVVENPDAGVEFLSKKVSKK